MKTPLKNKQVRVLAIFLLLGFVMMQKVKAQEVFLVTEENQIVILEISTLEVTPLFVIDIQEVGYIVDLAFTPDGTLYGITGNRIIIEIDLDNLSYEVIFDIPVSKSFPGLVSDADGNLLFSSFLGATLYKYTIGSGNFDIVTVGASSPGDFTYYKGNLIFPATGTSLIRAFDGDSLTDVGCTESIIFTFINDFVTCDTNNIYGIDEQNALYSYTIEENQFELVDFINIPSTIYGGATRNEYLASNCSLEMLNTVNCTLGNAEGTLSKTTVYPNPTNDLLFLEFLENQNIELYLKDMHGRILNFWPTAPSQISLTAYSNGVYFLEALNQNNNRWIEKIVKQ